MRLDTIAIVGVGLIGGSIGLAAKKRGLAERIVGVGRDLAHLEQARRLGAIDHGTLDLAEAVRGAVLVIFCTPVDRIAAQVRDAIACTSKPAIFTDAGSTKRAVVAAVEALRLGRVRFVGGHPLAGSEKKGVEHANADLFVNRLTILTQTEATRKTALTAVKLFWQELGARVEIMTPDEHDRAVGLTSHLPHLVAAALAGILPHEWHDLAASGFRDTTRIAGGDPEVWTPIFQQNRTAVLAALEQLAERLHQFRQALTQEDVARVDQLLTQGKRMRDALGS